MKQRFEMRRHKRVDVAVYAPIWDDPMFLVSSDLSPRGVYLECEELLEPEMPILCAFSLSREYSLAGVVRRNNRMRRVSDNGRPGFGVAFTDTRPLTRLNLRSDLRGLPPPLPKRRPDGIWLPKTKKFIVI
jgi:hypothetical protein